MERPRARRPLQIVPRDVPASLSAACQADPNKERGRYGFVTEPVESACSRSGPLCDRPSLFGRGHLEVGAGRERLPDGVEQPVHVPGRVPHERGEADEPAPT